MGELSAASDKLIDRRVGLKAGAVIAAAAPVLLRGGHAEAQPEVSQATALSV
jgi:hypothetical protein